MFADEIHILKKSITQRKKVDACLLKADQAQTSTRQASRHRQCRQCSEVQSGSQSGMKNQLT